MHELYLLQLPRQLEPITLEHVRLFLDYYVQFFERPLHHLGDGVLYVLGLGLHGIDLLGDLVHLPADLLHSDVEIGILILRSLLCILVCNLKWQHAFLAGQQVPSSSLRALPLSQLDGADSAKRAACLYVVVFVFPVLMRLALAKALALLDVLDTHPLMLLAKFA